MALVKRPALCMEDYLRPFWRPILWFKGRFAIMFQTSDHARP